MHINATALANYFIDLALKDSVELKQIGLIKRAYITHGFCLAIFGKSALDKRFDVVEAWKKGPVIPSIYHSFKHNGNNPIKEKSFLFHEINKKNDIEFITPKLEDEDIIAVAEMVWKRYKGWGDFDLVELLHREGTPWSLSYEEGKNNIIPDLYTRAFYEKLIEHERHRAI